MDGQQLENTLLPSLNKGHSAAPCGGYILLSSKGNLQPPQAVATYLILSSMLLQDLNYLA